LFQLPFTLFDRYLLARRLFPAFIGVVLVFLLITHPFGDFPELFRTQFEVGAAFGFVPENLVM